MEVRWPGKTGRLGDCHGGTLVVAGDVTGIVVSEESSAGFQPNRKVVNVSSGEIVELGRATEVTVYEKAKVSPE